MSTEKVVYLKDYRKPDYLITDIDLEFDIYPKTVSVSSTMKVLKNHNGKKPLKLKGVNLKLEKIEVDGRVLSDGQYSVDEQLLLINKVSDKFTLHIVVTIDPYNNTSLEGLYKSGNILCTQNEAEGFRKITYFADRPDVMACYTTKITADKKKFPYLLSNGNRIESGDMSDNRHFVVWQDPFPKPCYLFALVAGDLDVAEDTFITMSGRDVKLSIFVDKGKLDRVAHAMISLKHSMKWDEDRFGLECDLDDYKIVAVDSFNMGAMENKGLNIFNTSCALGNPKTATDAQLRRIEAVIAHEYFHNWTGNRVTCRDWFQLTLKEGLTVFRDHEFSADMSNETVYRIDSVTNLRAIQFSEDSGPLAHPIRPESYMEIDNFYTSTVYEKGQEVIRMIQTFIGRDVFEKGIDKYFELYDGQAVTTEDFINAMEDVSGRDFTQFKNWYGQAGTPVCNVSSEYDKDKMQYYLTVTQEKAANIKVAQKPFSFPFVLSLFNSDGQPIPLTEKGTTELVLDINKPSEVFVLNNIKEKPIPSLLRRFSAPVVLNYNYTMVELIFLFKYDNDSFNRYEAGQRLAFSTIENIKNSIEKNEPVHISEEIASAFESVLTDENLDPELRSKMLNIPALGTLLERMDNFNVDSAFEAREIFLKEIAVKNETPLLRIYNELSQDEYSTENNYIARRYLKNTCLGLLSIIGDKYIDIAYLQFNSSINMTDTIAAMAYLNNGPNTELKKASLKSYYNTWKSDALVINNWFSIQASTKYGDVLNTVVKLSEDSAFDLKNPNKIYALYLVFAANLQHFHDKSGMGYKLIADKIIEIDKFNPHVSSKLCKTFKKYSVLDEERKALMKVQLERISSLISSSKGLAEVVNMILHEC